MKMEASLRGLYICYVLRIFIISCAYSVNIQLYEQQNFTRLILKSYSSGCTNLPWNKSPYVSSIRTDTCFIAYNFPACHSSRSVKYMPGDINETTNNQFGRRVQIESFHICNQEEGGNQLNVDITKLRGFGPLVFHEPLESYRNICSCVNVPENVQKMDKWSIDNHHNDLLAYYEPCCSKSIWNPKFIAAGHNENSRNMQVHHEQDKLTNTKYKIQSFGPDPNSLYFNISCKSSQVIIDKINLTLSESTGNITDGDARITDQLQILANKIVELQIIFKVGLDNALNQQKDGLNKITEKFEQLHHNLTKIEYNTCDSYQGW